jgi:hypothetical protein
MNEAQHPLQVRETWAKRRSPVLALPAAAWGRVWCLWQWHGIAIDARKERRNALL